ncbi:MAG: hypothetical protein RL328_1437 [Acidobacteriota bacterium]
MRMHAIWVALLAAISVFGQSPAMTNDDVIKLAKSGLSEQFVTDLIDKQGSRLNSDVSGLIQLKQGGVDERIVSAVVKKVPAGEALNTDSVLRLAKAGFSDTFLTDLLGRRQGSFSTDASRIVELKQAGISERVLSLMVSQAATRELARGTELRVRLIDSIDSETNRVGQDFDASLDEPITIGNDVVAQKGARAVVRLVDSQESGKLKGRTALTLQLRSVVIDGKTVEINSSDVSQESGSRGARTAKSAAAVGAIGAIIGGIAGGGKGAAIGAAAGAGAGAGAQVLLDPQRVRVPSETVLTFVTERPTRF